MVKSCCAVGCSNRYSKGCGISFYRFPTDAAKRNKWIAAIRRKDWEPTEHSWLCSAHFINGKRSNDPLSPDYVPSIFSYISSPLKRKSQQMLEVYERRKSAKKNRLEQVPSTSVLEAVEYVEIPECQLADEEGTVVEHVKESQVFEQSWQTESSTMTDISMNYLEALEKECVSKSSSSSHTCTHVVQSSSEWSESELESDDHKVNFYTGLPSFIVLMTVFNFVSSEQYRSKKFTLSNFQKFMLTLMKLRLSLYDQDLAFRFGVHQSTVSRIFRRWIEIMYIRLRPLIKWPNREELLKSMPMDLRSSFKRCIVIIDCFEIFCERPYPLRARAQTYSDYKHHNTVKFLIGIAPQGVITFISKGWGGRVSDKFLTENCGILDHLLPGDQILADCGFTIQEIVALHSAEVKVPPFTRGKKQLSKIDIDTPRQLSRVRIHVERVIGFLRQKYTMLESTLPINTIMCDDDSKLSLVDKIVTVCCALCNCCESVVPFD